MTWSSDQEAVLERIQSNCTNNSSIHKKSYFYFKGLVRYFKIPTIVLSSLSSVTIALTDFLHQSQINLIVCGLGLMVSILNSTELFLKINESIEAEIECSRAYYSLAVSIRKTLLLDRNNRTVDGAVFLEKSYMSYMTLMDQSSLLAGYSKDKMLESENNLERMVKRVPSNSDSSIESPLPDNDLERSL